MEEWNAEDTRRVDKKRLARSVVAAANDRERVGTAVGDTKTCD